MCTTLRCMLTVYERIIFFSVLVTVRNHYFNILTFQMDDGIKRFGCHIFIQQINQTIPRVITFPVIKNRQSAVQKDIILQQRFNKLIFILIILEYCIIGYEYYFRSIGFLGRLYIRFINNDSLVIFYPFAFSVTTTGYQKITAQGIDSFDTDTIQTDRFLESFTIIFGTGIHFTGDINDLAQRHTTAVIANRYGTVGDGYFDCLAESHHVFVN